MSDRNSCNPPPIFSKHVKSIDHIAIAVHDLEQSIGFYRSFLGFELRERRRTEGKHTGMLSAVLTAGPITVVLLQGTSEESQISRYIANYGPGVQHVAFAVSDVQAVANDLKEAGLEFDTEIIAGEGLSQIFSIRDPGSGMMYEFIERHGDGFSNESVQNLFEQLEAKGSF